MRRHRRNLGLLFAIPALILASYRPDFALPGSALIIAGESLRIWAAGHLRKEQILTTGGPYQYVRNPLYVGSFLIALGFCLVTVSVWILALVLGYFLICYIPVIRFEEKILREKFPDQFPDYASVVPALIPNAAHYPSSTRFTWANVWKNKEYNAILGILAIYVFLLIR